VTETPRAVVWAGHGASYSWIWWADLLEDLRWLRATFVTDRETLARQLPLADLLVVGGGDVPSLRTSIDWDAIEVWLREGRALVATCAGAYMLRHWAHVGIANASAEVPENVPLHAWSRCEEGIVAHPVRGPVNIHSEGGASITAPLYGGPIFTEPKEPSVKVSARYQGVARAAEWLMADRPQMLEGTPAVVTTSVGEGLLILSGPHLEHPDYPPAHLWLAGLLGKEPGEPREGASPPVAGTDPAGEDLVRRLASVRRRASSIATRSWWSGDKLWRGDRVGGFAELVIPRARALAHWGWSPRGRAAGLPHLLDVAAERLSIPDRPDSWDLGFSALSEVATVLLEAYFASRRAGMPAPKRAVKRPPRIAPEGGFHAPKAPKGSKRGVSRR
jgi:hypothetical protein